MASRAELMEQQPSTHDDHSATSEQALRVNPVSMRALIRGVRGRFGRTRHPRTAFVLSGGASLGALQVGMLRALYEHDIVPDLLVGASAGALNAAFVASRPQTVETADELAAIWRGLRR